MIRYNNYINLWNIIAHGDRRKRQTGKKRQTDIERQTARDRLIERKSYRGGDREIDMQENSPQTKTD